MKKVAVTMFCLFFFAFATLGCSSSTLITSNPTGAKVYIANQYKGQTPYTHSDSGIVGSTKEIRLEKEGYKTLTSTIKKNGDANVAAIIGGIFFWPLFLWVLDYPEGYVFEMQPDESAAPAPAQQAAPAQPAAQPTTAN